MCEDVLVPKAQTAGGVASNHAAIGAACWRWLL
jgi:hypothetical protein